MVSDISETLREQQGHSEVAEQEDGDDQSDGVLHAHSRSTPFTISADMAKNATVSITKTRSCMVGLQSSGDRWGHLTSVCPGTTQIRVVNGFLTAAPQL